MQAAWGDFFIAQCGAAAALIGLLFVSLSINLQRIITSPFLVNRVGEAVLIFLGPFLFSIFGLAPGQSATTFGLKTFVAGAAIWSIITSLQVRRFRNRPPEFNAWRHDRLRFFAFARREKDVVAERPFLRHADAGGGNVGLKFCVVHEVMHRHAVQ